MGRQGRLNDIQTALKPFKKSKKIEIHFYDHLGLAESFKTMNRSDLTITLFDGLFSESVKDRHMKF